MSSNENLCPIRLLGDDDQLLIIRNAEAFDQDWQVYGGTGIASAGSAGSKGQFVDLGDANSSNDPATIRIEDDNSNGINCAEAFDQDWQVYGGTGIASAGSAGSKGQFVDLTPKDTDV